MTVASFVGKVIGATVAELHWYVEQSVKPLGVATMCTIVATTAVSVSRDHSIDSEDPSVVTENVFDCLEYLD